MKVWLKGKKLKDAPLSRFEKNREIRTRLAFYAVAAIVLTATNLWAVFLIYWLLPLATVLQVIVRWGAICEHKYNLINPSLPESTPIIELRWWDKLLLPNLNFTMHIYHHWYPRVPYADLPRVHEIYKREGLVADENVFHGYWAYLRFLLVGPNDGGLRFEGLIPAWEYRA